MKTIETFRGTTVTLSGWDICEGIWMFQRIHGFDVHASVSVNTDLQVRTEIGPRSSEGPRVLKLTKKFILWIFIQIC